MTSKPPPLPSQVLLRVLKLATTDGRILLYLAGGFGVLSAVMQNVLGAVVGCLAAGAGAMELHGVALLRRRLATGMNWLVGSQLVVLVVIVTYAWIRREHFDEAEWENLLRSRMSDLLDAARATPEQTLRMLRIGHEVAYSAVAIGTLFVQGGMAWFYHRRRELVRAALSEHEIN